MPQHTVEIYAPKSGNILHGERYASIQMPIDSTQKEMLIAAEAAKAAVSQVLGRLGVHPELKFVYIPNASTDEEEAAIRESNADVPNPLPSTEEVLANTSATVSE